MKAIHIEGVDVGHPSDEDAEDARLGVLDGKSMSFMILTFFPEEHC